MKIVLKNNRTLGRYYQVTTTLTVKNKPVTISTDVRNLNEYSPYFELSCSEMSKILEITQPSDWLFKTENIFTSLVGETERKLGSAIKLIEAVSPSIVFIDECERLGTRQQISTDSGTSKRFLSQLLSWLGDKERKAVVVLTANMPEQLDLHFCARAGLTT